MFHNQIIAKFEIRKPKCFEYKIAKGERDKAIEAQKKVLEVNIEIQKQCDKV